MTVYWGTANDSMKPGFRMNVVQWAVTVKRVGVKMQREVGTIRVKRILNAMVRDMGIPGRVPSCSLG